MPRPIKANLELTVSLGDEIRQDIPLINVTDKDVNFKIQLEGDKTFSGFIIFILRNKEVIVKRQSTGNF